MISSKADTTVNKHCGMNATTCIGHYINYESTVLYRNRYSNIQNIYRNSYTLLYLYNFPYSRRFISSKWKVITYIHSVLIQWYTGKLFKKHTGKYCSVFNSILSEYRRIRCKKTRIHGGFMQCIKCLKSPVSENSSKVNMLKGPNTAWICTTASLSYFFINLGGIELENASVCDKWNLMTVC